MERETLRLKLVPCQEELLLYDKSIDYPIGPHIESFIEKLKQDSSLYGWGPWFVFEKETGTIIGDMGFKGKPDHEKTIEVGYGIIPSARNKGYATEAVKELINWAFSTEQVTRIIAECLIDNDHSIRVLTKLGMTKVSMENNMYNWELKI